VAVIAATAGVATADVVIVKYGDRVVPAGTVTEAGTAALGSPLVRVTTASPGGDGPFSVIRLAVADTPPTTEVGDKLTNSGISGFTVRLALFTTPL